MSYGQQDRYPYPDRQSADGYNQNRQQYPDHSGHRQNSQPYIDEYSQSPQTYTGGHSQPPQPYLGGYSPNPQPYGGYGQNRQNSVDSYGNRRDEHNIGGPDNYGSEKYEYPSGQNDEPNARGLANYGDPNYLNDGRDSSNMNAPIHGAMKGSPTISEAKLLVSHDSPQKIPKRRNCWHYTLCKCWPRWARWICCTCLLIVLGLVIAVAIIAATFKVPSITLNGVTSQPGREEFVQNGTSFSFNFALKIGVVNDNIIGATFQKIKAAAIYPIDQTPVGGGELNNVNFPPHATTNLTFPFSIVYDPTMDKDQAVLNDIAARCGLLGAAKQPIVISYTVTLYLRVIFVTITPPPIKQKTSIECPIEDGQLPAFAQGLGFSPSGIGLSPTPKPTQT